MLSLYDCYNVSYTVEIIFASVRPRTDKLIPRAYVTCWRRCQRLAKIFGAKRGRQEKIYCCELTQVSILHGENFLVKFYRKIYVPEVLNVHTNEIYKKLTTIKFKKLKFKKVLNKITFFFSKVHFTLLEKKILLKK